jgi:hypothetical protein
MKTNSHESLGIIKPQVIGESIELVAPTQTLTKQKQLHGRNHHIPLNANNE